MGVLRDVVKGVKPVATDWTAHSLEAVAGDPSLGGTATEVSGRGARDVTRRNRLPGRSVLQYRHLGVLRAVVKGVKSVTTDWTLGVLRAVVKGVKL